MTNIIKRRKTSHYLQLHNHPVQEDLDDLSSIGLLTYIMSLPEDWVLYKTFLQNKFTRRKVDGAWKILSEKRYIIGFIVYVDRKKSYYYNVSDIPFTQEEYLQFVDDTLRDLLNDTANVSSIKEMPDSPFKIPYIPYEDSTVQNVQQSTEQNAQYTTEQIVQYSKYSSIRTVQNVHIQINKNRQNKKEQIHTNKRNNIDNYQEPITNPEEFKIILTDICNDLYTSFSIGRWSKEQWTTIIEKFVDETIKEKRYLNIPQNKIKGYAYKSIEKIADHSDYKNSDEFKEYQQTISELAATTDEPFSHKNLTKYWED